MEEREMGRIAALVLALGLVVAPALAAPLKLIVGVPDINQPPIDPGYGFWNINCWCTPTAAANVVLYWNGVMGKWPGAAPWEVAGAAGYGKLTAGHLGWFMDTNDFTIPNDGHQGTWFEGIGAPVGEGFDAVQGLGKFLWWTDMTGTGMQWGNPLLVPGKLSNVPLHSAFDKSLGYTYVKCQINAGRPICVSFTYWNPVVPGNWNNFSNEYGKYYRWGPPMTSYWYPGDPDNPEFYEDMYGVGHTVTVVGCLQQYDPDGAGPLPKGRWIVVHDNWPGTGDPITGNLVIPWRQDVWMHSFLSWP
jgi:hypothetical protein